MSKQCSGEILILISAEKLEKLDLEKIAPWSRSRLHFFKLLAFHFSLPTLIFSKVDLLKTTISVHHFSSRSSFNPFLLSAIRWWLFKLFSITLLLKIKIKWNFSQSDALFYNWSTPHFFLVHFFTFRSGIPSHFHQRSR